MKKQKDGELIRNKQLRINRRRGDKTVLRAVKTFQTNKI